MSSPFFRVNAHVFYYTLLFGISVGAAVGVSKAFTKPEKERLEALEQKYPELVQKSKLQRQQMQEFFDKVSTAPQQVVALCLTCPPSSPPPALRR